MSTETAVLSAKEVAAQLSVSTDTVNRWAADGLLQSFTLPSGRRRFRQADVDDLIAGRQETPDQDTPDPHEGRYNAPSHRGVA